MAHSRPASGTGPQQVEILLEEGVEPAKIQIAHTGDTDDLDYIEGLLDDGRVDRPRPLRPADVPRRRAAQPRSTTELLRRGHADRLFIGSDYATSIDWFPQDQIEGLMNAGLVENWTMSKVFEEVIPWLGEQGVWDDAVAAQVLEENPRRWLTGS